MDAEKLIRLFIHCYSHHINPMGIKNYLPHLPKTLINQPSNYDAILFDCNYILHLKIHACNSDEDLHKETLKYCKNIFKFIKNPTQIYIIFDGEHDETNNPKEETHKIRDNKTIKEGYAGQEITRGSPILLYFQRIMLQIMEEIKTISIAEFDIITSYSDVKGEGDLKINDAIKQLPPSYKNICIVTKDTDLVQISFIHSIQKDANIDVITDVAIPHLTAIKSADTRKMKYPQQTITIKNKKFNDSMLIEYDMDYIFAIALLGNDYLPRIGKTDYDGLIKVLAEFKKYGFGNILTKTGINEMKMHLFITMVLIDKNIKFDKNKLEIGRFRDYFNNLQWFLKCYGVIENDLQFVKWKRVKHYTTVMNIHNFFVV